MKTTLRIAVMAVGLLLFGWFVLRSGPAEVAQHLGGLGWWTLLLLIPYGIVYVLDTLGWYLAFGQSPNERPAFGTLFRVRWSGEAVNNVIPTAYIGGEAIKVYLLAKRGVPVFQATASVVTSKSCQVLAQVVFIGLGALAALRHLPVDSWARPAMVFIMLSAFMVVGVLFWLQRRGLFDGLRSIFGQLRIRAKIIDRHEEKLRALDRRIFDFYFGNWRRFAGCTLAYLAGWLADAIEVYLACHLMGTPVTWTEAVAIEAFIGVAKAMGVFVPGALGVQESGVVLLFGLFGFSPPIGTTYAILRRGRDLVYVGVGGAMLYAEEFSLKELRRRVADSSGAK